MKILLLNGTIVGKKTRTLLDEIQKYIQQLPTKHETKIVDLENYELQFVDGRPAEKYNDDMKELIKEIEEANAYVIATPVFQGSIPGTLKNVFDAVSPLAMRYKPVSIVANGGTLQHHLVVENQLKPILNYFRCMVTPNYVYTHTNHFSTQGELTDEDVRNRLKEMTVVFDQYMQMSQELEPDK
ncbi:FMN reductase [Halobacillus karajensis]|uniref:NAD(P)H-dependent FAD/FMN reductase n=1 Tax=Halobacillus karajensis TaxID=195088 RepID=A0A024P8K8_9BACI|nr:NAD(P)H-dependent oxidoreductase [Halobacillus karajensis]CDQ21540.1 NAD(P)H-dependent FAD/FMN reductase [Halobacillus karajensis]CDQ25474.1 NAD(P)H-dependent FAD/FMN reductase [Halobacillus karajensis]CDQ28995.1 NAD(P)H-dependent FAD/FMN reductase [Halobacillus karajensis]SEI09164.1 FMN reductase [Halobacillus karajensis]